MINNWELYKGGHTLDICWGACRLTFVFAPDDPNMCLERAQATQQDSNFTRSSIK